MPEVKRWLLRRKGASADTTEYLYIILTSEASEEQKSLAWKALTICSLEGWQVRKEEVVVERDSRVVTLHIMHTDVTKKETNVHFRANEEPQFPCRILGMDAQEHLLQNASNA